MEEVFVRHDKVLYVTISEVRIGTTAEHPVYVVSKGWLPAGQLIEGDRLVGHDGMTSVVRRVEESEDLAMLYNLRVADHHTYFVGCAEWGFSAWMHNACWEVVETFDGYEVRTPTGRTYVIFPKTESGFNAADAIAKNFSRATPAAPRPVPGAGGVRPQRGAELGRGVDGVVYDIPGEPGWVLKEFHHPGLQARNQYANMEAARRIRPNNVLEAQPPADPRQGWLIMERYYRSDTPPDMAQLRDFQNINDASGNLMWGYTQGNPTPRWLLIE